MQDNDRLITWALGCAAALMLAICVANVTTSLLQSAATVFPH